MIQRLTVWFAKDFLLYSLQKFPKGNAFLFHITTYYGAKIQIKPQIT
jgi:hypothetical protein